MTSAADFDKKYDIVDAATPRHTLMTGHYKRSFAYYTLRERLPVTLTSIIDNMTRDKEELVEEFGEDAREEIKNVVGLLSKLKYELQTDKKLEIFCGNEPDKDVWNTFLNGLQPAWGSFFKTCWLYAECYMYRRVSSFFEATKTLSNFDYFTKQKNNAMIISTDALEAVAQYTRDAEKSEDMFIRLLKLNLWGNRCDLSITSGKEVVPHASPFELVKELDPNVIVSNAANVWRCLCSANHSEAVIVDFICDNAGYELYTDFILAEYIIDKQLASKVRFHVKAIPWFISDVTPKDFHWSLQYMKEHSSPILSELGKKLLHYLDVGKFELVPVEHFWTSPYEYYKMREINNQLFNKIAEAHLAIFKGDLNYRKLVGDFTWDPTDNFVTCLRGFQPTNLCTLRTVKADLICGLPEGLAEELFRKSADWMITGEYGVIQFAECSNRVCAP